MKEIKALKNLKRPSTSLVEESLSLGKRRFSAEPRFCRFKQRLLSNRLRNDRTESPNQETDVLNEARFEPIFEPSFSESKLQSQLATETLEAESGQFVTKDSQMSRDITNRRTR